MVSSTNQFLYKVLFILGLQLVSFCAIGQNILADNIGKTSLSLNRVGDKGDQPDSENQDFDQSLVKVSTADKKLELNYYRYFVVEKFTDFFVGISGSGEMKNSASSLFANGNFVSGAQANFKLGFMLGKSHFDPTVLDNIDPADPAAVQKILDGLPPAWNLWLVGNGNFEGYSFDRLMSNLSIDTEVEKTRFTGTSVNIGLNFWRAKMLGGTTLAGLTIGYKRANNFDDLSEYKLRRTETFTDTLTGNLQQLNSEKTVYRGGYKEYDEYPLDIDYYYSPHGLENVAFLLYSRIRMSEEFKPKTKFGLGIYFLKKQDFFNPIAGINFDFADVFNTANNQDSSPFKRLTVGITTKITIVKTKKN